MIFGSFKNVINKVYLEIIYIYIYIYIGGYYSVQLNQSWEEFYQDKKII